MVEHSGLRLGQSEAEGFSYFDHATRADVGLAPRHGDRVVRESCDHLPLFDLARRSAVEGERMPRAAGHRRPLGEAAPLSMGHISSTSENKRAAGKPKPSQTSVRIWPKGSRCDFPGIQASNPRLIHSPPPKRVPRGKIETFSDSSRRNLKLTLHTITLDALAYTMALTLPGCTDGISGAYAKERFIVLCNRMTASRIPAIRQIGMMWKQELQKRGEVHFHLVLYGVTEETRRSVQRWIAGQWNELICSRSSAEDRAKHLWWHLRDGCTRSGRYDPKADNMQEIRNFAGYFAKYLGKDEKAQAARDPIPGRWWGKVNKPNIPWAEMKEQELPLRMRIHCQRIARKIRQKKADAAKHLGIMRELDLLRLSGPNKGQPCFSQFFLACGKGRKGTAAGNTFRTIFDLEGQSFGPVRFPAAIKFAAVKLTGKSAVSTGKRILEYARDRYRDELETCPF
jgi:hypothetical protein